VIRSQLPAYTPQSPALAVAALAGAAASPAGAYAELRSYLGRRFGAGHVLLTSGGTQALQVALQLATGQDRERRPIALPAFGCYDLITAAVGARARIVFYDLDPTYLAPDARSLRAALDAGVSAVVATPLYGFPLDWTWLRRECEAAGALLIEDSAQGLGSEWQGTEGGSFGDATVLSFGRGKGWSGAGGGALLIRQGGLGRLAESVHPPGPRAGASLEDFAASAVAWLLGRPWLYALPRSLPFLHLGVTLYKDPRPIVGPSRFAAASATRQAQMAVEAVEGRRAWASAWARLLEGAGAAAGVAPCRVLGAGASGYLRFPVLAKDRAVAEVLLAAGERAGVGPPYPIPLPELEAAGPLTARPGPMPGAVELVDTLVTLPTHPRVRPRDLSTVEGILRAVSDLS
jgi:dTDP-4-amino-4,6-dideoxygalactose transaminase